MSKPIFTRQIAALVIIASISAISCGSIKPSSVNSGSDYYESFYAGDGTTRYFIKPMELESKNEKLLIDINVVSSKNDTALANFSVLSEGPLKNIKQIQFANDSIQKAYNNLQKMFIELGKNNYESRYTVKIPNEDLKSIFADYNWAISVTGSEQTMTFTPKRKTQKKIVALNKAVFMLVE